MRKLFRILFSSMVAISLILTFACNKEETNTSSYAEDRALIEDLQARYLFALDSFDMDTYVATFTEDGILDIVEYQVKGRDAIRKALEESRPVFDQSAGDAPKGPYPATGRHNITNIVIKVDVDKAESSSYWFHYGNNNPERKAVLDAYGHYEDEMVKVNGEWLFKKRVIYNESVKAWITPPGNRAW